MHHYTESGLDNIYLVNGYKPHKTPYGKAVSIEDVNGLHKVIGQQVISREPILTGKEFRFLRIELNISQKCFAAFLGLSEQAIAKWEKNDNVQKYGDIFMRALYRERIINEHERLTDILKQVAHLEQVDSQSKLKRLVFEDTERGWGLKAA